MKRLLKIFTAAAMGLALTSCFQDDADLVTFVPENVTAPTWTTTLEDAYTLTEDTKADNFAAFTYTAVDFGVKSGISYDLYIALKTDEGFADAKKIGSATGLEIKVTNEKINTQVRLLNNGSTDPTEVIFKIVASMMGKSAATGITSSTVATVGTTVTSYAPAILEHPKVYVIGGFNGWDHAKDLNLYSYTDDENLYEGIIDFDFNGKLANHKTEGFKVTGVPNWDDNDQNWGAVSDAEGEYEVEPASVSMVSGSTSKNIKSYGTFRYYKFQFTREPLSIKKVFGFDSIGIIGNNNDWDNDIVMAFNPVYERFWVDVENLTGSIKFRSDAGWDGVNIGGASTGSLSQGGDNIPVDEAGSYRVYLYMNDSNNLHCEFDAAMYGKDEPTTKGDPEPEPEPEVWSVVGTINNWGNADADGNIVPDFDMTEIEAGVWERRKIVLTADDEIKLRFQHAWSTSAGIAAETEITIGTPMAAITEDAQNIKVGVAGTYNVTYDTKASTILIEDYEAAWSVIGAVNGSSWDADFFMEDDGTGIWKSDRVKIEGVFKIRYDSDWVVNRGGESDTDNAELEIGTATAVVDGGKNFILAEDKLGKDYYVTYNSNDETITVEAALPQNQWSLIGNVAGDTSWSVDSYMHLLSSGIWISDVVEITGEFKLRYNNEWEAANGGNNRGGTFATLGTAFTATAGGDNINTGNTSGKYQVVYNPMVETITVRSADDNWQLIGNIENSGWGQDFFISEIETGVWRSEMLLFDGMFKLRKGMDWSTASQYGVADNTTPTVLGTPFAAVTSDGQDIPIPTENKVCTVTLNTNDNTITIDGTWAVIGAVEGTSWDADCYLVQTSAGVWERKAVQVASEFKLRFNSSWDDADVRGLGEGATLELGAETELTNPGANIAVPGAGSYDIKWVPANNKLTVTAAE